MQFPAGSVQALQFSSSTVFHSGIGSSDTGYSKRGSHWRSGVSPVASLALAGFAENGPVPWLATSANKTPRR